MPRRNNRHRPRTRDDDDRQPPLRPLTTEDLARSLVRRGLAPSTILDRPHFAQKVTTT